MSDSSCGSSSRVIFPIEVKACAVQRILDGETQVQVARDLDCPVSTIASWWHRRASILPNLPMNSSVPSDSTSVSLNLFLTARALASKSLFSTRPRGKTLCLRNF